MFLKSSKVISVVFFVCVCHRSVTAQNVLRSGVEVVEVSSTKSQEWKDTPHPTLFSLWCLWPSLLTVALLGALPHYEALPEVLSSVLWVYWCRALFRPL